MTIRQLTRLDQPSLDVWTAKAINDPGVHPFLGFGSWRSSLSIGDSDWERAVFADSTFSTILSLGIDRECKSGSAAIWSLTEECRPFRVAAMMKHLFLVCPRRYDLERITFNVSGGNLAWNAALQKRFAPCLWGVNPGQCYDPRDGRRYDSYHYSIPVGYPQERLRRHD